MNAPPSDLIDRIRLIRSQGIGPVAFSQLMLRFGNAAEAIRALPDLARRGGGKRRASRRSRWPSERPRRWRSWAVATW